MNGKIFLRPVLPLLAAFGAGILLGELRPGLAVYAWGMAGLCLLWLIRDITAATPAVLSRFLLLLLLGYLSIQQWVAPPFPANHVVHRADRSFKHIHGRILTPPEIRGSRISFVIAVASLGGEGEAVRGRIRVSSAWEGMPALQSGDEICFSGRIRKIRNFRNPGGFDYARFMAFRDIQCSAHVRKGSLKVMARAKREGFRDPMPGARRRIHARIIEECPDSAGGILAALLIGEKSDIEPRLRAMFNRAGISHLLAISGLHIGSILALSYGAFRWIFAFITPLLWNGWLRKAAAMASLIPVLAYATLAQWSPSTQRAVCMAAAVCLSLWCERESDIGSSIALAALVILVIFPPALFSISFQLSFAAVVAIVGGMPVVISGKSPDGRRIAVMKEKVRTFMAMSLLAVLGTLPLSMLYFNQVSFIGIIANLFYIPLVGGLVLPLGLLSVSLFPISIALAGYGFHACGKILDAGLKILPFFSELPFGSFITVTPTVFEIGIYYAAGWAALMLLRSKASGIERPGGSRRRAALLWCAILAVAVGDVLFWTHDRFFRDDLRVTVIDVGQGSSALVEFPRGYRMLIDGGGYYDRSIFDVGERLVAPFLRRRKILTLDAVVLSHPDSDHLNGLLAIAEQFHVKTLWTTGVETDGENFRTLMETVERRNIPAPSFDQLPRRTKINGADLEIVYPPPGFQREDQERRDQEEWRRKSNNRSMVIAVRLGEVGILFPGDIEKAAEEDLVARFGARLRQRVLVAPHHGSRTSSTWPFLRCVSPEVVLVSAGWENRFRCPHPDVLARYREMDVRILRTDADGALVLETDGRRLVVKPAAAN